MKCPHCSSPDTVWKPKASQWECNSCEKRFDGDAPAAAAVAASPVPSRAARPLRIFFSYGHDHNRELVDRFKADLEARGHQVWIDYDRIGTWEDWRGRITKGIHEAQMAVAFLSVHSTRDPGVCRNEIAMALQHFGEVFPILVEEVPAESIPLKITHFQWPDLSRWREFRDREDLDFERFYEEKFLEIVSRVEGEDGRFASESQVLKQVLNPSSFEGRFGRHLAGFTGREWVFDAYEHWLDHQPASRVFWVKAGPGFGKTALAVQMAKRHRAAIVGTWFCDHQSVELRDPLRAVRTIACQLALRWDDYRARLLPRLGLFADSAPERIEEARQELGKKNLSDLFSFLISDPMAGLIWREHKLVILVDGLDEAVEPDGTNPLASLLSGRFLELPEWIGFVVTSRPDPSVVPYLQGFKPFAIEAGDARNQADLEAYASAEVGPSLPPEDRERGCALLVEKSAGMMLYLRLVAEGLREGTLQPAALESLESGLPGLHSRYHAAFEARLRAEFRETVQPLLRLVMAAPGPLPLDLAREVLAWDRETAVRARALLGSYLVEDDGGLSLFHKTLGEWLVSEGAGIYFTDPEPAAKALGEFLWQCFDEREEDANEVTRAFRWEGFVSDWLPKLWELTDRREDWGGVGELASWFREKILWKSAEALYRRALEGREKALGPEHSSTLTSVNNLGLLLSDKGDYEGAEALYRRALQGREKALGPEHPSTLGSVNNLGALLSDKGDYDGAEALLRRALEGKEKVLGAEHPDTLGGVNNLGNLLRNKGDYDGAEALLRRALKGKEKALGPEHPSTLMSVGNLGILLSDKGDYDGAEALYRRALEGKEKVLGPEHPSTLGSVNNLGSLLSDKGDYDGAEALYRRALEGKGKALGPEHPTTLSSANDLGVLLNDKGDLDGAEELYRRALQGREKALGPEHPKTLLSVNNLGVLLRKKGDHDEAEAHYRRAVEGYEKTLGSEHPDTTADAYGLAGTLNATARRPEAIALLRRFAALSDDSRDAVAYNLACYECHEGNHEEAKRLIAEHLARHPKKKAQALADEDFAAIQEFIKTL